MLQETPVSKMDEQGATQRGWLCNQHCHALPVVILKNQILVSIGLQCRGRVPHQPTEGLPNNHDSSAKDKTLFTPGPLTTSLDVKQAMLRDAGSWHFEFNAKVQAIREKILDLAGVSQAAGFECILLQGSGTFGVESVFSTAVPQEGKVLVLANGAYGERMIAMLECLRIDHVVLRTAEDVTPDPQVVAETWRDPGISHVAMVHCETTTGILNPIEAVGYDRKAGRTFIVDAMSSFGGMPIDFERCGIDFITSANKCLEGVPGFSIVLARRTSLEANPSMPRCLSLT